MPHNIYRTKLVILGDSTVGKTALTQMFVTDGREFPKHYNMTLGIDVHLKHVSIPGSEDGVKLLIYDSSGIDLYKDCLTKYTTGLFYREFQPLGDFKPNKLPNVHFLPQKWESPTLLAIVYDVTLPSSFESVPHWLEIALGSQWNTSSRRPFAQALVANKVDLIGRRFITEDNGKKLAERYNLEYFETSSKDNQGVEDTFLWLAKQWHSFAKSNTDNSKYSNINRSNTFKTSTSVY